MVERNTSKGKVTSIGAFCNEQYESIKVNLSTSSGKIEKLFLLLLIGTSRGIVMVKELPLMATAI